MPNFIMKSTYLNEILRSEAPKNLDGYDRARVGMDELKQNLVQPPVLPCQKLIDGL